MTDPQWPIKKVIPDSQDREEVSASSRPMLELVAANGRTPDEVAWELQKVNVLREIALYLPLGCLAVINRFFPSDAAGILTLLYLLTFPLTFLRLIWAPLRGQTPKGVWAVVQDYLFLAAALLGAVFETGLLFLGLAGVLVSVGIMKPLLQSAPAGFVVGGATILGVSLRFRDALASSLAERDLEGQIEAGLSEGFEEWDALSTAEIGTSSMRSIFRGLLFAFFGFLPSFFWPVVAPPGKVPAGILSFAIVMGLLGLHQTVRGLFYAAMGERTKSLLRERNELKRGHSKPTTQDSSKPRVSSALALAEGRDLAWMHARDPRTVYSSALLSGFALASCLFVRPFLSSYTSLLQPLQMVGIWVTLFVVTGSLTYRNVMARQVPLTPVKRLSWPSLVYHNLLMSTLPVAFFGLFLLILKLPDFLYGATAFNGALFGFACLAHYGTLHAVAFYWGRTMANLPPEAVRRLENVSFTDRLVASLKLSRQAVIVGAGSFVSAVLFLWFFQSLVIKLPDGTVFAAMFFFPVLMSFQFLFRAYLVETWTASSLLQPKEANQSQGALFLDAPNLETSSAPCTK